MVDELIREGKWEPLQEGKAESFFGTADAQQDDAIKLPRNWSMISKKITLMNSDKIYTRKFLE